MAYSPFIYSILKTSKQTKCLPSDENTREADYSDKLYDADDVYEITLK